MPDEQNPGEEPEINAVSISLADLAEDDDEDELEEEAEEEVEEMEAQTSEKKSGGALDDLMDDIFAEEHEEDDRLKAFGDLEHLTMIEVSSEVEAVLEELRIRQGNHD